MRDFLQATSFMVFAMAGGMFTAFGDVEFGIIALIFAVFFCATLKRKSKRSYDAPQTYTCIRMGDEFFLRDSRGFVMPSSRSAVAALNAKGLIKWN